MRALLGLIVLAAACGQSSTSRLDFSCGDGTTLEGNECTAPAPTCAAGTVMASGLCVPAPLTGYRIAAPRKIVADPARPVRVLVFGDPAATDTVVAHTDRAGAGDFTPPAVTLDPTAQVVMYTPCAASTPGCLGPVQLQLATAAAPTSAVSTVDVELIAGPHVGSADRCLSGGNVLYLEGRGFVYPGELVVTAGTFSLTGGDARAVITVVPNDPVQGTQWSVVLDSVQLAQPLTPGVYLNTSESPSPGKLGLQVKGMTPYAYCNSSYGGEVEVLEFDATTKRLTAAFRQTCEFNQQEALSGCVHVE